MLTVLAVTSCGGDADVRASWKELRQTGSGTVFSEELVRDLPDPARRFLLHAIAPDTPLARSVELTMHGTMVLEPERDSVPMRAEQVLAPPEGFIWRARAGSGLMRISGYDRYTDGSGEMHWRLWGLIPVMQATGKDATRSAAARLAMESILMPAAVVSARGARWEAVDDSTARFTLKVGDESVTTTLTVDAAGRPLRASARRWREAGDERPSDYARLDVEMEGDFSADGYTIPRHIQAGWRLGDPDEFRFFAATLETAVFR